MDIPEIGKGFEALSWYPTALIKCNCRLPQLVILIITGIRNLVVCPMCHNGYMIQGVRPDGQLDLARIRPEPEGMKM